MQRDDAIAAVFAAIAAGFTDAPPPVGREAWVYRGSWESQDLVENLAKVNDIPNSKFIEWHAGSLPEFTPVGLLHVLPFYLRYSLENPESEVTERVIFHLSPADMGDQYWRARLAVFTAAQKDAICEYVRFMQAALAGEH